MSDLLRPHCKVHATVAIRRGDTFKVKPEAEVIDGYSGIFTYGWEITTEDSSIYVGEVAMVPDYKSFPDCEVSWVASGDLKDIKPVSSCPSTAGDKE